MTIEHDQKIAKAEADLERCLTHMDALKQQFLAATGDALKDWFAIQTKNEVTKDAEHTASIGTEGLKVLKEQLKELQYKAPAIAVECLDRQTIWSHRPPGQRKVTDSITQKRSLEHCVSIAADKLISILQPNGYLKGQTPTGLSKTFSFSAKMTEAWSNYMQSFSNFDSCIHKIEDAKKTKAQEHAAGLWDEA